MKTYIVHLFNDGKPVYHEAAEYLETEIEEASLVYTQWPEGTLARIKAMQPADTINIQGSIRRYVIHRIN